MILDQPQNVAMESFFLSCQIFLTSVDWLDEFPFQLSFANKLLVHVSACLPQYIKNTPYLIAISASYPVSLLSF